MINLLPPDMKRDISYARRNTRLRNWSTALLICILIIGGIVTAGQLYLQSATHSYAAQVTRGKQQLEVQKLAETQNQVKELTNNLKLVVQVLSRQILFSKLLSQIGSALPNGSVLTGLSINTVQGGIDLQADAADYQTATQVQVNLQDPANKIFEKADIVNVQCAAEDSKDSDSPYPCKVQVRALFAKENPFLFITSGAKK